MPFEPGKKKTGGRKKGTPNKRPDLLLMIQDRFPGWHPIMAMAEIANDTTEITENGIKKKKVDDNLRFQACKEVCKYIVPQLKAVELSSSEAAPFTININKKVGD